VLPAVIAIGIIPSMAEAQFLGPQQVNQLPSSPADRRIHYGSDPLQFGELRLPQSSGRHPVAVVIHGGCWKSRHGDLVADLQNTAALSTALTSLGIATWNIEYRQTDNPGGGWTGTFEDVANAIDHVRVLAKSYPLDLKRVVVVGHSAGGHLGTWAAARHRLPKRSPLFSKKPLRIMGVINLAGPTDLERIFPIQDQMCGDPVITNLVGGSPYEVPENYRQASPSKLLPTGVKQVLITGAQDKLVPPRLGQDYEAEAKEAGDDVTFFAIENAAHFEVIAPGSVAWPKVEQAVLSMLKLKSRTSK
jgi:acetyl esterase/lipase